MERWEREIGRREKRREREREREREIERDRERERIRNTKWHFEFYEDPFAGKGD